MKCEIYNLQTKDGKHIRKATKVVFDNGEEIKFTERLTNEEAKRQAYKQYWKE